MRTTEKGLRLRTPKYVEGWLDRFGRPCFYYRPTKVSKRVRLPGLPYSNEFMAAYEAAKSGLPPPPPPGGAAARSPLTADVITLNAALALYFASSNFNEYADETKKYRRRNLNRFAREGSEPVRGERPLRDLTEPALTRILDEYESRHTAQSMEKALKGFFEFCKLRELIDIDPTKHVEVRGPVHDESAGFFAWEESHAEIYKKKYPLGSKARLVFALAVCLGLRRSDIVRFGPHDIIKGRVKFLVMKTKRSSGFVLDCKVLPELQEALDACGPHEPGKPFLRKKNGEGWVASSLSGQMREWCDDADLPECSTHGVRKLCSARLADAECDVLQIAAITGHKNIKVLMKYLEKRNRGKSADVALDKLVASQRPRKLRLVKEAA
jgi:integrase